MPKRCKKSFKSRKNVNIVKVKTFEKRDFLSKIQKESSEIKNELKKQR